MSTILLADDNRELAGILSRSLEKEGYSVDTASNEKKALAEIRRQKYKLIILDIDFGNTNGLTLLAKLRSEGLATPVMVLSSRERASERTRSLSLGANDYLSKPFSFEELIERMGAILRPHSDLKASNLVVGPNSLSDEFDALFSRMQTPQASASMKAAFNASPKQLGRAAVNAARKRG